MKPLLTVTIAVLLAASPCLADYIELSVFPTGGLCAGFAAPGVPFTVYVVHHAFTSGGAVASRWKIDDTSGFIHLGDTPLSGAVGTGDPYTGVAVTYPSCISGSVAVWQLTVLNPGLSPVGCYQLRVVPRPGDAFVGVTDCALVDLTALGGYFSFNVSGFCDDCAGALESATWGAVKALYR